MTRPTTAIPGLLFPGSVEAVGAFKGSGAKEHEAA